jgi:hypothetical protein
LFARFGENDERESGEPPDLKHHSTLSRHPGESRDLAGASGPQR